MTHEQALTEAVEAFKAELHHQGYGFGPSVPESMIAAFREALEVYRRADRWELIESAPKSETILVFGQPEDLEMQGATLVSYKRPSVYSAAWGEIDEAFCLSGGSWLGPFIDPTQWQPLPPEPTP